jgi:RNA polymerase sigma-70 factor, ECF subfamily
MQQLETYVAEEQFLAAVNNRSGEMSEVLSERLPSFYRTAYRFLGNTADAEDAVQDALLSAYKHLHEFRGECQLYTWLTAIVSNCARMQLRRRPRYMHVSLDGPVGEELELPLSERLADGRPTPEDECREAQLKTQLKNLAERLSPTLRRVFQLRDLEGLSIREAADLLNVPAGTVKAQLSRARAKLARSMRRTFARAMPKNRHLRTTSSHRSTPDLARRKAAASGAEPTIGQ